MTHLEADPRPVDASARPGVRVAVALRWADMDAYGHVNNVNLLRILEQARVQGFDLLRDPATTGFLVVRHEVEYLRPLPYRPDGVVVRTWVARLGTADFDYGYEVEEPPPGGVEPADWTPQVYARAETTMVAYSFDQAAPRRLDAAETALLQGVSGPRLRFRRR